MMWDSALGMTCAQDWRSTWLGGGPTTSQSREDPKSCIVMVSGFGLDPTDISITVPAYTPGSPHRETGLVNRFLVTADSHESAYWRFPYWADMLIKQRRQKIKVVPKR